MPSDEQRRIIYAKPASYRWNSATSDGCDQPITNGAFTPASAPRRGFIGELGGRPVACAVTDSRWRGRPGERRLPEARHSTWGEGRRAVGRNPDGYTGGARYFDAPDHQGDIGLARAGSGVRCAERGARRERRHLHSL